jgi:hypothetical protein
LKYQFADFSAPPIEDTAAAVGLSGAVLAAVALETCAVPLWLAPKSIKKTMK